MTKRKPATLTRKALPGNVDYVMGQILKRNPGITESDSWPIFRDMVLKDDDLIEACMFWTHAAARNRACKDGDGALTREEKRRRALETRARAAEMWERAKAVVILNHVMPNGLPLRECTFGYVKDVGGKFARIGDMGEPDQIIGEVLSDRAVDAAFNDEPVEREGPALGAQPRAARVA
jgi:hypothetical protein